MINKQNKNHHRYLHKRIPDIIIEPPKTNKKRKNKINIILKITHKANDNIIPILITKNKNIILKISMIKENPIYNLHTKKQYI